MLRLCYSYMAPAARRVARPGSTSARSTQIRSPSSTLPSSSSPRTILARPSSYWATRSRSQQIAYSPQRSASRESRSRTLPESKPRSHRTPGQPRVKPCESRSSPLPIAPYLISSPSEETRTSGCDRATTPGRTRPACTASLESRKPHSTMPTSTREMMTWSARSMPLTSSNHIRTR